MAALASMQRHHWSTILNFIVTAAVVSGVWGCPKKCSCLEGGIVVCQNKYLLEVPQGLPQDTQHLYLGANFIRKIRKNTFKHTKQLATLEISSNYLREIEPGAFEHVGKLRTLTLRDNNLASITRHTFKGIEHLENLDLSDVAPKDDKLCIEDGSFAGMKNLLSLKLDHNRMVGVSNRTLLGLHKLLHLDISNNNLQLISEGAFDSFTSTKVLVDDTMECCCETSRALASLTTTNNNRCSIACSDDAPQCSDSVLSTCKLRPKPVIHDAQPRTDYQKRSPPQTNTAKTRENIPQRTLTSKIVMGNMTVDVQIKRGVSYTRQTRRVGVGLTRNEQWSIAITTCLVFVVSVLMFLMAIYCKKKKFSYHMKCCSGNSSQCVLNQSSNSIVNEINLMNKYFTTPSESHI